MSIEIPRKKTALGRYFFERSSTSVAKDLLGRIIVHERARGGILYAQIHEVAAWEGTTEKSMTEGALYAPGTLSISTKFGKNLLDIATDEMCKPSCITLIAGRVYDKTGERVFAQGPGLLCGALDINKSYHGLPIEISSIWIGGERIDPNTIMKRKKTNSLRNCKGYYYYK